jgi:anti-anti-sigma regulatory factor
MKESIICKIIGELNKNDESVEKHVAAGDKDLLVDFSDCTFISVAGLEWLESMLLKATSGQVTVTFIELPPTLYKIFKVARIESILGACGSPPASSSAPVC